MKYKQIVVPISNYATDALQKELNRRGNEGYKFVNSVMANNQFGVKVMYLFFVKGGEG